jgi:four helix bundle protein
MVCEFVSNFYVFSGFISSFHFGLCYAISLFREMGKTYDLSKRLIEFSVAIITMAENLPATITGKYLAGQIIRSGIAPSLIYGVAMAAESRSDFIHKIKIALKELRETYHSLQIIEMKKISKDPNLGNLLDENNQLISIFVKSIQTARINQNA